MKIRNNLKTLLTLETPSGVLQLAGHAVSGVELTEADLDSQSVKKAIAKKWARLVKDKTSPVAKVAGPVVPAKPNVSSASK